MHDVTNIPDGSILSIRAGSTRRQAPLPLQEPLRFPNLPVTARSLKVDVLKSMGSSRLEIDAKQDLEMYSVSIPINDNGIRPTGSLSLVVKEEPSLCGKRAADLKAMDRIIRTESSVQQTATPSPILVADDIAKLSPSCSPVRGLEASKADARDYARDHGLLGVVQEMLQFVLRERPDAPYSTMSDFMRRRSLQLGELAPPPACTLVRDQERIALEQEHFKLRAERKALLLELARLESQAFV